MMAFRFALGDIVTYHEGRYRWGPRTGRYRSLAPVSGRGSAILVEDPGKGAAIFPGPDDTGSYDERHATTIEETGLAIRVRVIILQIGRNTHIGVLDCRLDETPIWTGPLSDKLHGYETRDTALIALGRKLNTHLHDLAIHKPALRDQAIDVFARLVARMPPAVQTALLEEH